MREHKCLTCSPSTTAIKHREFESHTKNESFWCFVWEEGWVGVCVFVCVCVCVCLMMSVDVCVSPQLQLVVVKVELDLSRRAPCPSR